jgi:universal stress protein A
MPSFQKILVPVDFSEHSRAAVDAAVEFARSFGGSIHLLHCYAIQPGGISPYGVAAPAAYFNEIREAAQRELDAWSEKLLSEGVEVTTSLRSDSPSPTIVEVAYEIEADLIVIGTRGLSGIKHVMLGSVAERTVRTAPCPVLTVKASDGAG